MRLRVLMFCVITVMCAAPAAAQMSMSSMSNPLGVSHARDGSGTSWQPDDSPVQAVMVHRGQWMLMFHANGFVQYIKTGGERGKDQFGSVNWVMGMAQRPVAGGQLQFRAMMSAEPVTVGRCGFPVLLQTGESCRGAALHDEQHPHDLFMELAASFRREITSSAAFELYGGLAGEPALGPTAFPHRVSAMPNPIAPISHHWLDSSHISFGVVTAGVYGKQWKLEGSAFNGREPDDDRYGLDLGALDSYSGRVWFTPHPSFALQVSAGHLTEAEGTEDVDRITASATYHRVAGNRTWATTIAWGQNRETENNTSAFLVETGVDVTRKDTVFARGEIVGKTEHDLVLPFHSHDIYNVAKAQLGYVRWLGEAKHAKIGAGFSGGLARVPEALRSTYGARNSGEFAVFLTVRTR